MYGKNTLDKIYLTQKKLLPHPSTSQRGKTLTLANPSALPKGKLFILSRTNCYSLSNIRANCNSPLLTPALCSLTPIHCSLFSDPCSLTPAHCFMLKISCNTKKIVPLHQITFMGVDWF